MLYRQQGSKHFRSLNIILKRKPSLLKLHDCGKKKKHQLISAVTLLMGTQVVVVTTEQDDATIDVLQSLVGLTSS